MKPSSFKIVIFLMLTVCVASALAGYYIVSRNLEEPVDEPEPIIKQTDDTEEDEPDTDNNLSLLTNEILDEDLVRQRPIAVMMEHSKAASPQYGVNRSGIIYECPMEGGMTRTMQLFDEYEGIDRLGNIRSARPYFIYLASEYNAIYFHYGQSIQGEELLKTGIIEDINGLDGTMENVAFYRSDDRRAPHNAYTSTDRIHNAISQKGYDTEYASGYETGHFFFADDPRDKDDSHQNKLESGERAEVIRLYYPDPKGVFVYYDKIGAYKRIDFGDNATDGLDGDQVSVKNIILEYVDCSLYNEEGPGYLNIPVRGAGKGKFFTNGRVTDISWEKSGDTARTRYLYQNGEEIKLNTGRTWICLIDNKKADKNEILETREEYFKSNGE